MSSHNAVLQEIYEEQRDFVMSSKKAGQWAGIETLLRSLYPDEAHFICELLQNAEDVRATEVSFRLEGESLIFKHNGERLFDEESTRRIITIGSSFKKDDPCQIGKFGIGFKSVFAYTTRPEVHSGEFDFAIEEMVCPVPVPHLPRAPHETVFVLRLDQPDKGPEQSLQELVRFFEQFRGLALLFLRHIHHIEWDITESCRGSVSRKKLDEHIVALTFSSRAEENYYFLYSTPTTSHPELDVCVAFELKKGDGGSKITYSVQEAEGKLCIYFPAEKEPTQLRFHIHAPFAPTVDRASIPWALAENKELVQDLAACLVDSLSALKSEALLDVNLLAVLPSEDDNLPEFLEPLLDALCAGFRKQELIPLFGGGFAPSSKAYLGAVPIREVLGHEGLQYFTGKDDVAWAFSFMRDTKGHRVEELMREWGVRTWSWTELDYSMDQHFHDPRRYRISGNSHGSAHFLEGRDIEWLSRFYVLLHELVVQKKGAKAREWCVVLAEDGSFNWGKDVYHGSVECANLELKVLDERVLTLAKSDRERERVRDFLHTAGVGHVGLREQVQAILSKCYAGASPLPTKKLHREHMGMFIRYWRESGDTGAFDKYRFLYTASAETEAIKSTQAYLDTPFKNTGIRHWFEITKDREPLWNEYRQLPHFVDFMAALGVCQSLLFAKSDILCNPDWPEVKQLCQDFKMRDPLKEDWNILGLDKVLQHLNENVVKLIWHFISNLPAERVLLRYQPSRSQAVVGRPAMFLHKLRRAKWIPCKDGVWRMPREATKEDLPDWLPYDNRNKWLDKIQLGHASEERRSERERIKLQAERMNIDPELALELSGLDAEAQKEFLRDIKRRKEAMGRMQSEPVDYRAKVGTAFNAPGELTDAEDDFEPPGALTNVARRAERRAEELDAARALELAPEERLSFHIITKRSAKSDEVRQFLLDQYGGRCQMCGVTFDKRRGGKYFVAVYLLKVQHAEWLDHPGNVLCLCPNHAARLEHGSVKASTVVSDIERLNPGMDDENRLVEVELCGRVEPLRFTARHLVDVQTLLAPTPDAVSS